jgi:cytochrome c5
LRIRTQNALNPEKVFYDEMAAGVGVLMPLFGAQATQDPEAVYNRVCVVPAPANYPWRPKGRPGSWTPRLAQGMETLVQHDRVSRRNAAWLCMDCSAEDYQAIILDDE